MEDIYGKICPFCKGELRQGEDIVVCSACDMPHHKDCWVENQGCTTFGCSGTIQALQNRQPVQSTSLDSLFPERNAFCTHCGAKLEDSAKFCTKCGALVPNTAPAPVNTNVVPNPAPANPYVAPNPAPVNPYVAPNTTPANPYAAPNPAPINPYAAPNPAPANPYAVPNQALVNPYVAQNQPPMIYNPQSVYTAYPQQGNPMAPGGVDKQSKVLAAVGYLGILVLVPLLSKNKSPFVRFHANQSLILLILELVLSALSFILGLGFIVWLYRAVWIVLQIVGVVFAAKGEMKEFPLIGKLKILH